MSIRRAAPGVQVSQGRLRVDAARAIQKLREYQLTDRAAWVLEGIRAAVAAGGTKVVLRGDSNDIWLGWHGAPWEPELLPRLFDELVSPEISDDKQHIRLLAAAVNSALGMDPAYVDVYSITGAGQAKRARYTPEVLAEPENELGDAPLRHVAVEQHEPPTSITSGMLVHVRRKFGFETLSYWVGEPPELPMAREHCRDIGIPLALDGDRVLQRDARNDLVRIPLDEGLDGYVAITSELVPAGETLNVAERGVVLAQYAFDVLGYESKVLLPVRVFVDAQRLPSNASRSQVRRDVHPITTAERRAKALIGKAIAELVTLVGHEKSDVAMRARRAALLLLRSSIGGHPAGWRHIPELLAPLAELPLVKNCFGEPRTVKASFETYIHTEKAPLPPELEPWLREILWAPPNDDVRELLSGYLVDVTLMRRRARWARQQRRAHQKFLAHSKRELVVQTSVYPRARVPIGVSVDRSCVPQQLFEHVAGEICVYGESRNAAVVLCIDGREVERIELVSAIPFDAVLDSNQLTPDERYRRVLRDDAYGRVDRAMRAAVVRAVESIAVESDDVIETDRPLFASALLLAKDLGYPLVGPLTRVPIWRRVDGGYASYDELQACGFVGVIAEAQTLVPPVGRVVVHANGEAREELRRLLGSQLVSYHKAVDAKPPDLRKLASSLAHFDRAARLIVRADGVEGAIAIASQARVRFHHRGIHLADREYKWELVKTAIAIDSDAIVPNDKWTGVLSDAKLGERGFRDWELSLVRAIAGKLLGDDVPDLVSPDEVIVDDFNFTILCDVLMAHDPAAILGSELTERVRKHPMIARVGKPGLASIQQLALENVHGGLFFVEKFVDPAGDFAPILTSAKTARLVARLGGVSVHDGMPEMRRRQKAALQKARLDGHLAKPEEPLVLDTGTPTVEFRGKIVRGLVGLTEQGMPEVAVRVENRPFTSVQISPGYPVTAVVDIAMEHCGEALEGISNLVREEITDDLRGAVPALLEAIAKTQPQLLGAPGPARRMLSTFLGTGEITDDLRSLLRSVPAFVTIQGDYRSIESVEGPPTYLRVASFAGDWLSPDDGESPTAHDGPVLRVANPPDELSSIIGKLHMDVVGDVTSEINRLQARRRMSRGIVPTPKLTGVPEHLKRSLKSLGEITAKLGPGEVAFSTTSKARVLLHHEGMLREVMDIDVMPAIDLAVEAPHAAFDHPSMVRLAQDIAVELVRTALPPERPVQLRRNLARAVLSRRVPPAAVSAVPLFQKVDGNWIDWQTFVNQLGRFEDVWAVTVVPADAEPIERDRFVLHLDAADIEIANTGGFKIINAKLELELDAQTRKNMGRERVARLALPHEVGVLATVELEGNGTTSPRGIVAVLSPQQADNRGVYPHRAMQPLDRIPDVCRWPTICVVDDARIVPDRTWSVPKGDETWAQITKALRAASEKALEAIGEAPGDVLAEIRITNHVCSDVKALREAPRTSIRGLLWLSGVPYRPATITFRYAGGIRTFVPERGLAIGGSLAVFSEDDLDIGKALEQLSEICHGKLVRMVMKDDDVDRDVAAAHVAHAIAIGSVKPTEVSGIMFRCFAPKPISPRGLASLFRRTDSVYQVRAGTTDIAETAFVDDGSELAKVVKTYLGERLTRRAPPPLPKPAPPPPPTRPPVSEARPAPRHGNARKASPPAAAPASPPKPKKPHVMQPLVDALSSRVARLGIQTVRWEIAERATPMFACVAGGLIVAGDASQLRKVAAELAAEPIKAEPAIDALAAHVVSVLNLASTEITDGSEMHALGVLLATLRSANQPRSRRSS